MPRLATLKPRITAQIASRVAVTTDRWRNDTMTANDRGYTYAWRMRRLAQLRAHPLCIYCLLDNHVVPAAVADHIVPHRGDPVLFAGELQSLCASCHSGRKAREESSNQ